MDIRLENQIVILDEAHNIEDSSRGAASWSVTPNSLDEAMKDLDYLGTQFLPIVSSAFCVDSLVIQHRDD